MFIFRTKKESFLKVFLKKSCPVHLPFGVCPRNATDTVLFLLLSLFIIHSNCLKYKPLTGFLKKGTTFRPGVILTELLERPSPPIYGTPRNKPFSPLQKFRNVSLISSSFSFLLENGFEICNVFSSFSFLLF